MGSEGGIESTTCRSCRGAGVWPRKHNAQCYSVRKSLSPVAQCGAVDWVRALSICVHRVSGLAVGKILHGVQVPVVMLGHAPRNREGGGDG